MCQFLPAAVVATTLHQEPQALRAFTTQIQAAPYVTNSQITCLVALRESYYIII
jgi:hypothetical protein